MKYRIWGICLIVLLVLVTIIFVKTRNFNVNGQESNKNQDHSQHKTTILSSVDGASNPDLIPDEVCYEIMLDIAGRNPGHTNNKLKEFSLKDEDINIILDISKQFHQNKLERSSKDNKIQSKASADLREENLKQDKEDLQNSIKQIDGQVSLESNKRLHLYLQHMKQNIRIGKGTIDY